MAPTVRELAAAGWLGVSTRCRACRYRTIFGFNSRWVRPDDTMRGLAARLMCSRCKTRPQREDVRAYFYDTPHGPPAPAPPGQEPSAADAEV